MLAAAGLCGLAGPAAAATQTPAEARALLSQDGFGVCVPEENLDAIWLALAKSGKSGRVPHVCMAGGCEDLPDIADWAAAQQYPEDIDLDRDDVQARYAGFVAEVCGPEDADLPEEPEDAPPLPPEDPLIDRALPPLLDAPGFPPPRGGPPTGGTPTGGPPPGNWPPGNWPPGNWPPGGWPPGGTPGGPVPADPLPPQPPAQPPLPPVSTVPLPAGLWLLLAALGLGLIVGRRRAG